MQAFMSGSTPPCQELTMETIDNNNNKSSETHYVTTTDIKNMDPCSFPNGKNVASGKNCKNAFTTISKSPQLPEDPLVQMYFLGLTFVVIYIFIQFINKSNRA